MTSHSLTKTLGCLACLARLDGGRIGGLSALLVWTRGLSGLHECLKRRFEGVARVDRKGVVARANEEGVRERQVNAKEVRVR